MANIKLTNANGEATTYSNVDTIKVPLADGTGNFSFLGKTEQTKTVSITSSASQDVTPDSGSLLSKVTINVDIADWDGSVE